MYDSSNRIIENKHPCMIFCISVYFPATSLVEGASTAKWRLEQEKKKITET